jgi:Flp pilus assembly protein TadG
MSASFSKHSHRTNRRGFVLPTAAVLFIVGIPICGLVIDVGAFYMIQSRLQAAVDAGALAGARALARGTNTTQQQTSAQDTAIQYVDANYPSGYMASTGLTRTAVADISNTFFRTVTVNGSVNAPHLFMRWFGGTFTTISARAVASRRDVNVIVVMDRSNSLDLSGSCTPLKAAAVNFVNKFSEGRDYVGLVTFATTHSLVVAPTQSFHTPVTNSINAIVCEGSTNSSAGLWLAYQALTAPPLNQPAALNVILFFTDGQPTSISANFAIKSTSSCTNKSNRVGVITSDYAGTTIRGLMDITPVSPMPTNDATPAPLSAGCSYYSSWQGSRSNVGNDITGIPSTDIFGNSLTFGYHTGISTSGGLLPAANTPSPANENNFVNGAENAAVHAAVRIRQPAAPGNGYAALNNVVIFTIGLGGSGAASDDLLEYIANDPVNTSHYDNTKPAGLYVYAANASELATAFNRVASEILRLAQ